MKRKSLLIVGLLLIAMLVHCMCSCSNSGAAPATSAPAATVAPTQPPAATSKNLPHRGDYAERHK